ALSDGFYAPGSAEAQGAVAQLHQRVPLGATSLEPALKTALKSFAGDHSRSIVYVGDGMSTLKLVEWSGFRELLADLRKNHVPVSSFAVGPRTDLQLLGVLAEHTGGVVYVDGLVDDSQMSAEKLGQKLAAAADASV